MINTGYWKFLALELIFCFIHPLPFIWNITYKENYPDLSTPAKVEYRVNDSLLLLMCLI